ncbi:esterase/lipase family protein [Burkholderia sp. YIM B11467]
MSNPKSNSTDKKTEAITIQARHEPGGGSSARVTLTPDSNTRAKEIDCDPRQPIPVIFIPGVMGSLLVDRNNGKEIWDPPNGITDSLSFAVSGYFENAAERQTRYDPHAAMVSAFGEVSTDGCDVSEEEARRRGWGSVHCTSYHSTFAWLERELNNPADSGKLLGAWAAGDPTGETFTLKPIIGTPPRLYGAHGPTADVIHATSDEFKKFCEFRYPVYAIGYNWLQSNLDSARDVVEGIDCVDKKRKRKARLMGIREICAENKVKKAIIITHSMGGLVTRMASVIAGHADLMYGVIHGAQPATGAPLAARRFRAGAQTENTVINQVLAGRNSREFTAVTANAPGPLELLPMPDYHGYEPWWIVRNLRRDEILKLPKPGDTLSLYASQAWYGLVPHQTDAILDPAGIAKKRLAINEPAMTIQKNFQMTMREVVERQTALINKYHPNTYAFYGSGPLQQAAESATTKTNASAGPRRREISVPREKLLTFGRIFWRGDFPASTTEEDLLGAQLLSDNAKGQIRIRVKNQAYTIEAELMTPNFAAERGLIFGDGTVPVWSGEAVARGLKGGIPGGKAEGVRIAFDQNGMGHQECFKHPWARWATLYSLVKIARTIDTPT